jgi:hypothetical protein
MLTRARHIIEGWSKTLKLLEVSEDDKALSTARMEICMGCEFAKESKILMLIKDSLERQDVIYCPKCKCPCNEKSLVPGEKCPENKW